MLIRDTKIDQRGVTTYMLDPHTRIVSFAGQIEGESTAHPAAGRSVTHRYAGNVEGQVKSDDRRMSPVTVFQEDVFTELCDRQQLKLIRSAIVFQRDYFTPGDCCPIEEGSFSFDHLTASNLEKPN
jgi:hypothetical protein